MALGERADQRTADDRDTARLCSEWPAPEALRIARLEAENRRLAEENTFLKKAAAFFAREQD